MRHSNRRHSLTVVGLVRNEQQVVFSRHSSVFLGRQGIALALVVILLASLLSFIPLGPAGATDSGLTDDVNNSVDPDNTVVQNPQFPADPEQIEGLGGEEGQSGDEELPSPTEPTNTPTPTNTPIANDPMSGSQNSELGLDNGGVETPSLFAFTPTAQGTIGTSTWAVGTNSDDGWFELHIGPGTLPTYVEWGTVNSAVQINYIPWAPYKGAIRRVVFDGPVDTVNNAQLGARYLLSVANGFTSGYFSGMANLTDVVKGELFDTSKVRSMAALFYNCSKLTDLEFLRTWDVSNVTNVHAMFWYCTSLVDARPLGDWNIKPLNTAMLFHVCTKLKYVDLSNWDLTSTPAGGPNTSTVYETGMQAMFAGAPIQVLKLGPDSRLYSSTSYLNNPSGVSPYSGLWQELGTGVDYERPNGSWIGTSVQLCTRSANVALAPGTYVWQRGFSLNGPPDFDFGQYNSLPSSQTDFHLFNGSYTAAEIAGGFDVYFVSSGTKPWHATAQLSNFTDGGGSTLPPGVILNIDNLGLSRTDAAMPTVRPTLTAPSLQLVPGGPVTRVVGAPTAAAGKGVWKINMPFDDITLTVPGLGSAYLNSWSATLTWSLNDTV